MEKLQSTKDNFMQIINNDQYGFNKQIEDRMKNNDTKITYEMVDEIPTSPANKRAIWQSVKIVKEITKIMKSEPKNIYVEFAREEVYCGSHNIVGVNEKHVFQIMHSGVIQGSKFHHKRSDGKDDQPSKCTGDHSQLQHSGSVSSGFFQVSFSHDLPKKNGSRTCNGKTEYRANVPHHSNQGISGNRVSAKVSQDYRIHGKSNAPGQVVSKCRK